MKGRMLQSEKGQSLVLLVFVMVAMIALVGLALDGGNMFLQRREVQNAVDAAAMAGTRELARAMCGEAATDETIAIQINTFAESNGIADTDEIPGNEVNGNVSAVYVDFDLQELGEIGTGAIPQGTTGIQVSISAEEETYFMRVVGVNDFSVGAKATAMTSAPNAVASGVRPVAVPLDVLNIVDVGDELTFKFGNKCNDGSCAVIWTSHGGGSQSHRGWVSLGYSWNQGESPDWGRDKIKNASNKNIKDWMEYGYDLNPFYADNVGGVYGDYIYASPGLRQSAIDAAPIGEIIILPVFDYFVDYDDIPEPKPSKAGNMYYHIVGFIGVRVTDINPPNEHSFDAVVENVILGFGEVTPGGGYGYADACETHMMVINLWQ